MRNQFEQPADLTPSAVSGSGGAPPAPTPAVAAEPFTREEVGL